MHRDVYKRQMQNLMLKVQKQAKAIKKIQEVTLPNLRQQLAETTGIFKGKERKALEKQIQQTEAELDEKLEDVYKRQASHLFSVQTLSVCPCFCPYEPKQGQLFIPRRPPYPAALRKCASLPL